MSESKPSATDKMARRIREEIATKQFRLFKEDGALRQLSINPDDIKRKGGRPPLRARMDPYPDHPEALPHFAHTPEHILQLVFKQKWQAGLPFSNNGSEENKCFSAVAEIFNCHPREIRRKYYGVNRETREKYELWLVRILLEFDEVRPTRIRQAKALLGIGSP